jgi:capping protein alpha
MSDEEYEEDEPCSPEEALGIADFFIMSSPIGEVSEVVKDLKVLINKDSEILTDAKVSEILAEYNTQMMESGKSPDDQEPLIVCKFGQVSANTFVDPSTGNVHTFDHAELKFTGTSDEKQTIDEKYAGYRKDIAKAVRGYVRDNYVSGKACTCTYASGSKVTVALAGKNVHLGNFWTGSVRASYTLDVASEGKASMSCSFKVNCHYFEDGNVQLNAGKEDKVDVVVGDSKATAKAVASAIDKFEADYHGALEEMYINMSSKTFRSMRRILPINGNLLNWNLAAHNILSSS